MEFALESYPGNWIKHYDENSLHIGEQKYVHSMIVTPNKIIEQPHLHSLSDITSDTLSLIFDLKPEIFFIGCEQGIQISAELIHQCWQKNISCEVMKMGAACRTFNVLASEQRSVAALFIFKI